MSRCEKEVSFWCLESRDHFAKVQPSIFWTTEQGLKLFGMFCGSLRIFHAGLRFGIKCLFGAILRSGRSTVGRCTGPKWFKMVKTSILVKMALFRTGF